MKRHTIIAAVGLLTLAGCAAKDASELTPQDAARPMAYFPTLPNMGWIAVADVECQVEPNGHTSNCRVVNLQGNQAFAAPAVEYGLAQPYLPSAADRPNVAPRTANMHVGFVAATNFLPTHSLPQPVITPEPPYVAGLADGSTVHVKLRCTILATGYVSGCTVRDGAGNPALTDAALKHVSKLYYTPAWRGGHFVADADHDITIEFSPPPAAFANQPPPPPKDVVFSAASLKKFPHYPGSMADRGTEATVLIICDLGADGNNRNCVIGGVRGDPEAGPAALAFYQREKFYATRDGQPVALPQHGYVISFRKPHSIW